MTGAYLVQQVQLLDTDGVNLVENGDHGHINSVSLDNIDQIINRGVRLVDRDLGIVDSVLGKYSTDTVVIDLGEGYTVGHQDLL